ncbi:MAG: hypothetical protein ABII71_00455 [Candidatus Micrarchaeota archaeon]
MGKLSIIMLFTLLLISSAFSENFVVVNSFDGRDVLSAVFYANALDYPVKFMPSQGSSADILAAKVGGGHDILLIQSSELPISGFVKTALESRNNTVELFSSSEGGETNLELAIRSGAKKFIIVDSAYSDSALSVLTYAARTNSYVILANKDNIDDVEDVVQGAESIMIFGLVDAEVRAVLSKFNPEIVGNGEDRYEDNLLIVGRTMEEFGDADTVIANTGQFIEEGMAEGKMPILLSGRIVPQLTKQFIKTNVAEGRLKTILLVSNDLVIPLYDLRDIIKRELKEETGEDVTLGIIVKFGQAVPSAGTDVMPLDTFSLPAYVPALRIEEAVYNADSDEVMVTVENLGEGSAFYTNELRISVDGADYLAVSDDVPQLIERDEKAGTSYSVDLSEVMEGEITATVITRYGYSKNVLDSWDSLSGPLTTINYTDISELAIQSASYDPEKSRLLITVRNNGAEPAFFRNDVDIILGGAPTVVKGTTQSIDGASLMVDGIPLVLSGEDFAANPTITINMDYGAREGFLVKEQSYTLPLEKVEGFPLWLILLILVILFTMIAVILFIVTRKRKKRTEERGQE